MDDFEAYVVREMQKFVAELMRRTAPKVLAEARTLTQQAIGSSHVWTSLLTGELQKHLGLESPKEALDAIMQAVLDSVRVTLTPPNGDVLGGFVVEIVEADFKELLASPAAEYTSFGKPPRGKTALIPWLSWLLFEGTNIIILGSEIKTDKQYAGTRTGGLMVTPKHRPSRGWHIPEEFAGTERDNFVTRALEPVADLLVGFIIQELTG